MKENKSKATSVHDGHRQRFKDKVRKTGLSSLPLHEVLEYLLTYTIPRKDTNALAHELINKFGGFSNVFDAGYDELIKHNGVGKETALFLSTLPTFVELYKSNKAISNDLPLTSPENCVSYFRNHFEIHNEEHLYLLCLNRLNKVIKTVDITGTDDCSIQLRLLNIAKHIVNDNIYSLIICHTHPKGSLEPSEEDIYSTGLVMQACAVLGILFCDHIIFNETEHRSLVGAGDLDDLFKEITLKFPNLPRNLLRLQQKTNYKYTISKKEEPKDE